LHVGEGAERANRLELALAEAVAAKDLQALLERCSGTSRLAKVEGARPEPVQQGADTEFVTDCAERLEAFADGPLCELKVAG
jgi:hypothetical protein